MFLVKKGNTGFDWTNLTGSKIGLVDGWAYDEHCIARQKDTITVSILITNFNQGKDQNRIIPCQSTLNRSTCSTVPVNITMEKVDNLSPQLPDEVRRDWMKSKQELYPVFCL